MIEYLRAFALLVSCQNFHQNINRQIKIRRGGEKKKRRDFNNNFSFENFLLITFSTIKL